MQRAARPLPDQLDLCAAGGSQGRLGRDRDEGVQQGIERGDTGQEGLGQFHRGKPLARQQPRGLGNAQLVQRGHDPYPIWIRADRASGRALA